MIFVFLFIFFVFFCHFFCCCCCFFVVVGFLFFNQRNRVFRADLSAGQHKLKWIYFKVLPSSFSRSSSHLNSLPLLKDLSFGSSLDMAMIDKVAIIGTKWADSECDLCSFGYYSAPGSQFCEKCPMNTYSDGYGYAECLPCPETFAPFYFFFIFIIFFSLIFSLLVNILGLGPFLVFPVLIALKPTMPLPIPLVLELVSFPSFFLDLYNDLINHSHKHNLFSPILQTSREKYYIMNEPVLCNVAEFTLPPNETITCGDCNPGMFRPEVAFFYLLFLLSSTFLNFPSNILLYILPSFPLSYRGLLSVNIAPLEPIPQSQARLVSVNLAPQVSPIPPLSSSFLLNPSLQEPILKKLINILFLTPGMIFL